MTEPSAGPSRAGPMAALIGAAAFLALTGAVVLQHVRLREVTGRAEAMAGLAGAAALEDRLIGQRLPALGGSELRVLWIVDLGRCAECLGDLAGWHGLGAYRGLERRAILTGAGADLAGRIAAETGLRGHLADPGTVAAARDLLGREPPASLALLIDDAGEVILADARDARTACRTDPMERIADVLSTLRRDPGGRAPPAPGSPESRSRAAP